MGTKKKGKGKGSSIVIKKRRGGGQNKSPKNRLKGGRSKIKEHRQKERDKHTTPRRGGTQEYINRTKDYSGRVEELENGRNELGRRGGLRINL